MARELGEGDDGLVRDQSVLSDCGNIVPGSLCEYVGDMDVYNVE